MLDEFFISRFGFSSGEERLHQVGKLFALDARGRVGLDGLFDHRPIARGFGGIEGGGVIEIGLSAADLPPLRRRANGPAGVA